MRNITKNAASTTVAPASTKPMPVSDESTNGLLKTFRDEDVSVSIFGRNRPTSDGGITYYSVSYSRSYKDADGERKYTRYFDLEDLDAVATLTQQAKEFIEQSQKA
jgi:hypothetical protein